MAVQQRQDHQSPSPHCDLGRRQSPTSTSVAVWQQQKWRQEQEKEWESHLTSLQQCICELLVKNQKLRDSLTSAKERNEKLGDGYDQNMRSN
jgi:hypothetical protein